MPKPPSSNSNQAKPNTLIHALAAKVQEFLHFPDPMPLYVVLGTVAGNMMSGSPVWTMLVGPPSSGRTVLLESILALPRMHSPSVLKGPSSFLSAVARKDVVKGATGGLLREVGRHGMLMMKDFTSVLSLPHEARMETIAAFREVYDGRWSRAVGTNGGMTIKWEGRLGFLGGVTNAIDEHHQVTAELGERWVYYRYAKTDGFHESSKAMSNTDREAMQIELREWVAGFFDGMGLEWPCSTEDGCVEDHQHRSQIVKRQLSDDEKFRLISMASLMVRVRSSVPRESRPPYEISGIAQSEVPTRLGVTLAQLYLGLERVGLPNAECWRTIGKVALDSAPQLRIAVVQVLNSVREPLRVGVLADLVECSSNTVKRSVEDLAVHGVVEVVRESKGQAVRLTAWARKELEHGWKGSGKE